MKSLTDRVDALFAEWDKPGSPGCALGVIKEGQFVYTRGYGMANLDYDIPMTADSVFYIASTSKQFTTASIALLALRGEISLDDDVRKYVPEIPQYDHPITIRHLVYHTSGLRDYLTLLQMAAWSVEDYFNIADAIDILSRQKALNFEPGEEYLYCNSGYALMAEIVKRVSGKSLREFAQENIFRPLGMTNTQFDDDRKMIVKNRVTSYEPREGGGFQRYLKNFDAVGSGGLLTTVKDLYLWDQNFYDPKVGGRDLVSQMLTRGRLNDGKVLDYAFGLEHGEYRGLKTVSHGGGMLGFRTQMLRFPEQQFTVICLANLSTFNPTKLAHQVADVYLADEFTKGGAAEAEFIELSEEELQVFAGVYQSSTSGTIVELFVRESRLMAETFGVTFQLVPVSATGFRAPDAPADIEVEFERLEQPLLMHVVMQSQEPDTFQAIEVVSPTPEQLADYAGDYYSDELQVTYKLVLEDGKLYARHCPGRSVQGIETLPRTP